MKQMVDAIEHKRLRAPRGDGQALLDPSLPEAIALLSRNVSLRLERDREIQGRWLRDLQAEARSGMLSAARQYTGQYRDLPVSPERDAAIIAAGHQPELVHPGVWFKSFALSELAKQTSSWAVNLLIDNDAVRSTSLRVPTGSAQNPTVASVLFDRPADPIPYEERPVLDHDVFASFCQRVLAPLKPLVPDPLLRDLWPNAVEAARQQGNLGRSLAQARHALEGQWGLRSLELPLGLLCADVPFRWFAVHLLREANRLKDVYNYSLHEYRRVNRVRSHTHPVADLTARDSWLEVPFWLWAREAPQRRAAFVRLRNDCVELTDFAGIRIRLHVRPDGDAQQAVAQLESLELDGIVLRPRALITTMFARLFLSDLFIHGIGGAKYDQLTDAIVRRFLGLETPAFTVATCTAMLPVTRIPVVTEDIRRTSQQVRELTYHPELYVDQNQSTLPLIQEKWRWIQADTPRGQRRERHRAIERVNDALQPFVARRRQQLIDERRDLQDAFRKNAILSARDYAFCLFPERTLRDRLLELCTKEP